VIVFGFVFGKWLLKEPRKTYQRSLLLGLIFLAGFVVLRMINGFGSIRPIPFGTWMDFLQVVKYPPSMTFVFLTMGVNLVLLYLFSRLNQSNPSIWNPLLVFGRVPLFSYLFHLVIYALIGKFLVPEGISLLLMYPVWLLGLGILYPLAYWYGLFKSRQSEKSWVRFF